MLYLFTIKEKQYVEMPASLKAVLESAAVGDAVLKQAVEPHVITQPDKRLVHD